MPKIIATRRISETRFINLVEDTYLDKKGNECTWVKAERVNNQNAVMIIATIDINGTKGIVVTKEYRVPIKGYEWGTPAGLIDTGETPVQTAIRELKEETGFKVSKVIGVSPLLYNSPGMTDEGIYLVHVEVDGQDPQKNLEDPEDIVTYIMQKEGVETLLSDSSKLFGAKSWLIFKQFVNTGEVTL